MKQWNVYHDGHFVGRVYGCHENEAYSNACFEFYTEGKITVVQIGA